MRAATVDGSSLTGRLAFLLYGMKPGDPLTLGTAAALLALVALAANYAPASRASRLQPMDALREE